MSKFFKHNLIYIYLISLLLNLNFIKFFNIEINDKYLNLIISELLIIDLVILTYILTFYKEIFYKIKEISKLIITKYFYIIYFIGFIGIIISIFHSQEKVDNSIFILLFNLNSFKIFIGLLIFLVLVEKKGFVLEKQKFFYGTLVFIILILVNFYTNGHISRLHYPFTNKTIGYNLLGLLSGILFFMILNFNLKENTDKIKNSFFLFLYFSILFFCFSKTAIFSFTITFIFYYLFLNKNISKNNILLSMILIIILIFSLDFIKYFLDTNSMSFIDIILNPLTWTTKYGSFYYRIEHVWLSGFDKDLNLLIFLFGEGIYSPKTHDSLYFTVISRFGFLGLCIFFYMILYIFSNSDINSHSILTFCLIFGLTSEMIIQSNVINPLVTILIYINFSKRIILR